MIFKVIYFKSGWDGKIRITEEKRICWERVFNAGKKVNIASIKLIFILKMKKCIVNPRTRILTLPKVEDKLFSGDKCFFVKYD